MMKMISQYKLNWKDWVKNYFARGRTIGVYLLLLMFVLSAIELIFNKNEPYHIFIPLLVMTVFSYGLFTDLVAHLWFDSYDTDISYKQFFHLIFKGRTHDMYGLIVYTIFAIYVLWYINKVGGITLIMASTGVILLIIKTKFYH